ncbi:MAG: hypothetical protein II919_05835 [Lachnospiraceae bacterium]|nr:hypothetical protein [Lachnospiraceae bacterium]
MRTERHGYTFTTKNNARLGIVSTILAGIALVLLIAGIVLSYKKGGNAGMIVGLIGTLSFAFSMAGLISGLRSFNEKDRFYLFSWIGSIINAILWIAMCAIIVMGMMS